MYRITVKSPGMYHNATLGSRYCFRKKSCKELIKLFSKQKCDFTVEKFIRISGDTFCWSEDEVPETIQDFMFELEEKEEEV